MTKNILFDFDGVILDSMPIRESGFRKIFEKFSSELVDKLIKYHEINGGLSRFVKIKYFFEELLKKEITNEEIYDFANKFSEIMRNELPKKKYLIQDTVHFIENNYKKFNMHIVSGSEEKELNYLCEKLNMKKYFKSIKGSPTPKAELVYNLLKKNKYSFNETILIGDSINDYAAAKSNNLRFYGFNNKKLKNKSYKYVVNFHDVIF
jgi:HAD superfamily hydrolase (TIGR01549 family)